MIQVGQEESSQGASNQEERIFKEETDGVSNQIRRFPDRIRFVRFHQNLMVSLDPFVH